MKISETQPAEPIVIPRPKRKKEEKIRPNKSDPWTVPAPKVSPTPKAMYT